MEIVALVVGALGLVFGPLAGYLIWRRGTRAPQVLLELKQVGILAPHRFGIRGGIHLDGTALGGGRQRFYVPNLYLLELVVSNRGPGDVQVPDAGDLSLQDQRPHFELPEGFKNVGEPALQSPFNGGAEVAVAPHKPHLVQKYYVHIHRLARGLDVTIRLLCSCEANQRDSRLDLTATEVVFVDGWVPNVSLRPRGLLR